MDCSLSEILQTSILCNGLTEEQISRLISGNVIKIAHYNRNEILYWTDKAPEKLYVLISGNIAMAKDTASGRRSLSKSIQTPGELTGEVRLFSPKKLLWEYAVALENSDVLEIDAQILLEQGAVDMDIQVLLLRNIISDVVGKIDYLGQKVNILSIASARGRIAHYLLSIQDKNRRIILNTTREELADYLGMARPSLSRELGRMQDDGIIRLDGQEVHVLNQAAFDALFEVLE